MTKLREPSRKGFTLIELMIVVAIIGILAAIAIPKFAELIRKSSEGASKGNLGALRSALSIYYGDMEGLFPFNATALTIGGKYLTVLPNAKAPNYHADARTVLLLSADGAASTVPNPSDAGAWYFINQATNANLGNVLVNSPHTDNKRSARTAS